MVAETEKVDLEKWQGPMTVVGYPDLSWQPNKIIEQQKKEPQKKIRKQR